MLAANKEIDKNSCCASQNIMWLLTFYRLNAMEIFACREEKKIEKSILLRELIGFAYFHGNLISLLYDTFAKEKYLYNQFSALLERCSIESECARTSNKTGRPWNKDHINECYKSFSWAHIEKNDDELNGI